MGVGVIGAGVISAQYLTSLVPAADVRVAAIADLDVRRAADRADEFGVPSSGTVDEVLARDDVEIVLNLTTPDAHVPIGLAAIEAGKHVFSEKPLGLDRKSGTALLEAADRAGLRVACAPDTVLGPGMQAGRRLVEAGVIGTPQTALAMFQVPGPELWHPSPEFLFARGGGPLFDMGPYYLSALFQCLGPATRVVARGSRSRTTRVVGSGPKAGTEFPVEVPTHVAALVDYAAGPTAQVVLSFDSARRRVGVVEIAGSEGTLCLPDPNGFDGTIELWRDERDEPESIPAAGSTMGRGQGVVDLARAIRDGRPERTNGRIAFHVLDTMCAIDESAGHGEAVELESPTDVPPAIPADWDPFAATF